MKRYLKYILLLLIAFCIEVKADTQAISIDMDYTTVYSGDEIKLTVGYYAPWDEGIALDSYDSNITGETISVPIDGYEEPFEIFKGRKEKYRAKSVMVAYDKNIFDMDLSNIKDGDNFIVYDYNKVSCGEYVIYIFDLEMKDIRDYDENYYIDQDKNVNDVFFSNVILKSKEGVKNKTGYLYVDYHDEEENECSDDSDLGSGYPINIIEKENDDKDEIIITADGDYMLTIETDKYEYNQFWKGSIYSTNYKCNTRCHVTNQVKDNYEFMQYYVPELYFKVTKDNSTKNYLIHANKFQNEYEDLLIIVGDYSAYDLSNYERKVMFALNTKYIKDYRCYEDNNVYRYNESEMNINTNPDAYENDSYDYYKKYLSYIKEYDESSKEPQVFIYKKGELIDYFKGILSDEELAKRLGNGYTYKYVEIGNKYYKTHKYVLTSGEKCPSDDDYEIIEEGNQEEIDDITYDTHNEESNKSIIDIAIDFIHTHFIIVIGGFGSLIIILIIIIVIIKKKKKNKTIEQSNNLNI